MQPTHWETRIKTVGILDFIFKQALVINVQHALPGRVRLFIPLIKKIEEDFAPALDTIEELLFTIPGITSINPNYLSGRVLIHYDPDIADVDTIIHCFRIIWKTIVVHRKKLLNVEDFDAAGNRLVDFIKANEINLKNQTKEVLIPDEIWLS